MALATGRFSAFSRDAQGTNDGFSKKSISWQRNLCFQKDSCWQSPAYKSQIQKIHFGEAFLACARGYRVLHHVKTIWKYIYIHKLHYIKVWYAKALKSGIPVSPQTKTMTHSEPMPSTHSEPVPSTSLIQMVLKIQLPKYDTKQIIKVSRSYLQIKVNICATQTTVDSYGNPTASILLEWKRKGNVLFWILKEQ